MKKKTEILPGTLFRFSTSNGAYTMSGKLKQYFSGTVFLYLGNIPRPSPGHYTHFLLDPDGDKVFFVAEKKELQDFQEVEIMV